MSRKRDYKKEYRDYHGKPEQIKRRAARNKARKIMRAKKGEEVDHKDGNPRNNSPSNLRISTPHAARVQGGKKSGRGKADG